MTETRLDIIDPATVGAGLLARSLQRQGVETTFGICGHLDLFFGAMEDIGMRLIGMRHEAAVVHAADGYARASGQLGVGIVTAGPGIANAVGGIASAWEAGTPLLIIAGHNALNLLEMGAMQELDGPRLVSTMTKWSGTVQDASRIPEYVELAAREALTGRPGPVVLEVPSDIIFHAYDEKAREEVERPLVRASRPGPDPEAIERAADAIGQASRPLIVAGGGAYWGRAGDGLARLTRDHRVPVFMKGLARGLVPEDMEYGFPWSYAQTAAPQADLVILLGTRINSTLSYANPLRFDPAAPFIQIDVHPEEIGRNHPIAIPIASDTGLAASALADALDRRGSKIPAPHWIPEALEARKERLKTVGRSEQGLVHPLRIARELQQRLPKDAIIVADGASCLNWFNAELRIEQSPGWLDHSPFGCMGVGVPFAVGARAAEQDRVKREGGAERPVFMVTGDGSFSFYMSELATASYYGLPFTTVIANDGAWGANRANQKRNLGRNYGTHIAASHYEIVAQGLDCFGELVEEPGDVGAALDRAIAAANAGTPSVVNVMCDPEVPEILRDDPLLSMGGATGHLRKPIDR